jgi:flagellar motor protein MotB
MFSRKVQRQRKEEVENPFLLSFSDLMAGILIVFVLALIVTLIQLERRKQELDAEREKIRISLIELVDSLEEIQQFQERVAESIESVTQRESSLLAILEQIREELKKQGVEVIIAENGTVLRIPENQLQFDLGRFNIPTAYINQANAIGRALKEAISQESNRKILDTVFIEGHTDSVPNLREMGNWGLSTYRAISLWNFWTDNPGELAQLQYLKSIAAEGESPRPLISVSGYADTRSTHGVDGVMGLPDNRPEDRRIDIRFILSSSEKGDLEELRRDLEEVTKRTSALIETLKTGEE